VKISERRTQFITLFAPPEGGVEHAAHPTLYRIGWFGLILCLLGLLGGKALQNVGMVLLLVATIWERRTLAPIIKKDPLFKAIMAWILYLTIRTLFALFEFPETGPMQIKVALGMYQIILIFIFAFWIRGTVKTVMNLYIIAIIGLFLTLLLRIDWLHLRTFFDGEPGALGIHHSNVGLIFSTAFIGWIIFSKTIWERGTARYDRVRIALWVLVLAIFFQWILLTQLRIIWAGLILWMLCALVFLSIKIKSPVGTDLTRQAVVFVSVVLIGMGLVFTQWNTISARLLGEETVVQKVLARDFEDMPATSFGARTYLLEIGLEAAKKRILFGWGPATTPILIQQGNIPESIKEHSHLHNSYLEIFVRVGLIGLILIGMILFLLIRAAIKIQKESPLHLQISIFSLSAFLLFGIANMTDIYLRQVGWFFLAIIGGVVYSFCLYGGSPTSIGQARLPLGPNKEVG
jgi:O-antigen ligase